MDTVQLLLDTDQRLQQAMYNTLRHCFAPTPGSLRDEPGESCTIVATESSMTKAETRPSARHIRRVSRRTSRGFCEWDVLGSGKSTRRFPQSGKLAGHFVGGPWGIAQASTSTCTAWDSLQRLDIGTPLGFLAAGVGTSKTTVVPPNPPPRHLSRARRRRNPRPPSPPPLLRLAHRDHARPRTMTGPRYHPLHPP